jgi:PAS domain S-box-containing protein
MKNLKNKTKEQLIEEVKKLRKEILKKATESEEGFRYLADASMEAIFFTKDGICLEANQVAAEMFGYNDPSEFVGMFGTEVIALESHEIVKEHMLKNLMDQYEAIGKRKDGTLFPITIRAKAMPYKDKGIVRATSIMDITERKQIEKDLELSNSIIKQERNMFIAGPAVVFKWKNTEGWPVEYVSDNVKEVFAYSVQELTSGKVPYADLIPQEDIERVGNEVATNSKSGAKSFAHQPYRIIRKDGKIIWIDDYTTILRNEKGVITHYLGYIVDITERMRMEEMLRESELQYRVITEASLQGMAKIDAKGCITFANMAVAELSGYSLAELDGMSLDTLFLPGEAKAISDANVALLYSGKPIVGENTMTRKDGSRIETHFSCAPILDENDEYAGFIASILDITERKKTEEMIRESEEKFRNLAENSPNMIFINQGGKVVYANKVCEDITEYNIAEFYSPDFDFRILIQPEYLETIMTNFKGHVEGRDVPVTEFAIRTKSGKRVEAILNTKLITFQEERAILGIMTDITERKKAEEELKIHTHDLGERVKELRCFYKISESIRTRETIEEIFQDTANIIPPAWHYPEITRGKVRFDGKEYVSQTFEETKWKQSANIVVAGKVRGSIEVYYLEECPGLDEGPFMKEERNLINGMARTLSEAIERKQAEKALKESEKKAHDILNNSRFHMWAFDGEFYSYLNKEWYNYTGQDPTLPLTVERWTELVHPDDLDAAVKTWLNHWETKTEHDNYFRLKRKDGEYRYFYCHAVPILNEDGSFKHFQGFNIDITDRKQAEKRIEHLNLVLQAIRNVDHLIVTEKDRDRLIKGACENLIETRGYNYAWIAMMDKSGNFITVASAGLDQDFSSIIKILKSGKTTECVNNALKKPEVVIIENPASECKGCPLAKKYTKMGRMSIRLEYEEKIYGLMTVSIPVELIKDKDEHNLLKEVADDIAYAIHGIEVEKRRKQVEEKIKISEEKYRTLTENLNVGVYRNTYGSKGKFVEVNPAFLKILGYKDKNEVLQLNVSDLYINPDDREKFNADISVSGFVSDKELLLKKKDGTQVYCSISAVVVKEHNKIKYFDGIIEDITKRKKAEEELQNLNKELAAQNEEYEALNEELTDNVNRIQNINTKLEKAKERAEESDRLKTAFLHNISHEIRTPMSGILGFTNLLLEPELTGKERHEYIKIIEKSGDRMLNTVTDLMDISMIESGQVKLAVSEVNVNKQNKDLYNFFKPEAEKKGIQLFFKNTLPDQEAIIKTDREKIYAILTNLIKNAIKYSDKGTIEFGYNLKHVDQKTLGELVEPAKLEFFVKDKGIGISKDRLQAIFDRFVQADIEDIRAFEGSGLGLSISKAYVEMLGGRIWVESEEGIGSQFYFTIPYNPKTEEKTGVIEDTPKKKIRNQIKGLKVLIAEDVESADKHLSIVLKKISKEILHSKTGVETVDICRNNPDIDLVLMDIKMPLTNGHEATRKIREFNENVVIIAQTAYALSGDKEKSLEAGCNDYISKPINKNELIEMIIKHINAKMNKNGKL